MFPRPAVECVHGCVCVGKHKSPVLECDLYFFLVRHDPDSFSQGEPSAHLMYFAFFFLLVYIHTHRAEGM